MSNALFARLAPRFRASRRARAEHAPLRRPRRRRSRAPHAVIEQRSKRVNSQSLRAGCTRSAASAKSLSGERGRSRSSHATRGQSSCRTARALDRAGRCEAQPTSAPCSGVPIFSHMKAGQESKTAVLVCIGRALANGEPTLPAFSDPTAFALLPEQARRRVESVRSQARPKGLKKRDRTRLPAAPFEDHGGPHRRDRRRESARPRLLNS